MYKDGTNWLSNQTLLRVGGYIHYSWAAKSVSVWQIVSIMRAVQLYVRVCNHRELKGQCSHDYSIWVMPEITATPYRVVPVGLAASIL